MMDPGLSLVFCQWLIALLVQGTVVLVATLIAWRLAKNGSAAIRHMIMCIGVATFFTGSVATIAYSMSRSRFTESTIEEVTIDTHATAQNVGRGIEERRHGDRAIFNKRIYHHATDIFSNRHFSNSRRWSGDDRNDIVTLPDRYLGSANETTRTINTSNGTFQLSGDMPFTILAGFLLVYCVVAIALAARVVLATHFLTKLRNRSKLIDHDTCIRLISATNGSVFSNSKRLSRIQFRISDRPDQMPMAFGIFKPTVLLPKSWLSLSDQQKQAIIAHEIAHLDRLDPIVNFALQVVMIFCWPNPLIFFCARLIRHESETVADNQALNSVGCPTSYASALVEFIRKLGNISGRPHLLAAQITGARSLENRIAMILDPRKNNQKPHHGHRFLCMLYFALVGICASISTLSMNGISTDEHIVQYELHNERLETVGQETEFE